MAKATICPGLFAVGVASNVMAVLAIRGYRNTKTTTRIWSSSWGRPSASGAPDTGASLSHCLSEVCTYCAILHLAVERYLPLCFPHKARVVVTKHQVKVIVGLLWAFAFLSAGPFLFLVGVEQPNSHPNSSCDCKPAPRAVESSLLAAMFWVTTSYFILPVICLNILYSFIDWELWWSNACLRGPSVVLWEKGCHQTIEILDESLLCPSSGCGAVAGARSGAGGPWLGPGAGLKHPQLPGRVGIVQGNVPATPVLLGADAAGISAPSRLRLHLHWCGIVHPAAQPPSVAMPFF